MRLDHFPGSEVTVAVGLEPAEFAILTKTACWPSVAHGTLP